VAPQSDVLLSEQLHLFEVQPDEWPPSHLLHGALHPHELLDLCARFGDHVPVLLEPDADVRPALPRQDSVHVHLPRQLLPLPVELSPRYHAPLLWQRLDHACPDLHNNILEPDGELLPDPPPHTDPRMGDSCRLAGS